MLFECTQTVSILHALIFGAGDACIRLDLVSILTAFGAFIAIVVFLQFLARQAWVRLIAPRKPTDHDAGTTGAQDTPFQDDPNYSQSAIRTSRR